MSEEGRKMRKLDGGFGRGGGKNLKQIDDVKDNHQVTGLEREIQLRW